MKKLKLNIDDLKVESFEVNQKNDNSKGTIKGFATATIVTRPEGGPDCPGNATDPFYHETCDYAYTCAGTCDVTCPNTCDVTCGSTCGSTCGMSCDCSTWGACTD